MKHSFEELKKKTVAQLKELAKGNDHEALHGYSSMHKEDLVLAICKALGVDTHEGGKKESAKKEAVEEEVAAKEAVEEEVAAKEPVEEEVAEKEVFEEEVAAKEPAKEEVAAKEPVKEEVAAKEKVEAKSAAQAPDPWKAKIKAQIAKLKEKRTAALEAHDSKQLKFVRRNIHALKHKLRKGAA